MRGRKRNTRLLSLLLCLAMLTALIPTSGLPVLGTAEETDGAADEIYIVEEDVTKRGEYEKHFLCSDGIYRAVTYAEPVHYYDSSTGTWQDNDIALTLNAASTRYEAQSGSFAVSFAKSYAAPNLSAAASDTTQSQATQTAQTVTMSNGIYPISWTTAVKPELSAAEGTAVQKSAALGAPKLLTRTPAASILTSAEAEAAAQQPFAGKPISDSGSFEAANRISVAEYANIAQTAGQSAGVSLRYSVSQNQIKEDIIISDSYAVSDYEMKLNIGDLFAHKLYDGSVELTNRNGAMVYKIGIPYLYDANDNISYAVDVDVQQNGSECIITYSPDKEWLYDANRAYPVVLDPTITSSEYECNIVDTYVTQADSLNHSGEGNLTVGIKNGKLNRAYIKISKLPHIPDEVIPLSATLVIKHGANTTSGRTMQIHRVSSSWSPSTITYANKPTNVASYIDSCAFNTSNVTFDFSQSQVEELYSSAEYGTNHGFMIRYSSESMTNPDYNVLRSMEYPTASERPAFTVAYGYTLPDGLKVGEIYSFKNYSSKRYLDVSGGTDADNNNVIQWGANSTVSQDFKLEKSSTGNGYILRAQVGGKTRVLDIYKTNGRVENNNNVQIYRNVDPIAQEWLILPRSATQFKIVPRSNPSLALTAYGSENGSSTGKTATSMGNVFVQTYSNSSNQWWEIYDANGKRVSTTGAKLTTGEYYLNSYNSSKYLRNTSNFVGTGKLSTLGSSVLWKITYINGKYTLQPSNAPTKYLAASTSSSGSSVSLISASSNDIPERCFWTIEGADNGGIIIKSYTGRYLYGESNSVTTDEFDEKNRYKWLAIQESAMNEMRSFTVSNINITSGESASPEITPKYQDEARTGFYFTDPSTFRYTSDTKNADGEYIVRINNVQGIIIGNFAGKAKVVAEHIPSGLTSEFWVTVTTPAGSVIPDNIPDSNIYNLGGRYFYIPHDNLSGHGKTGQMQEMLQSRGVDGYEELAVNCVLLGGTPNNHTVFDIGYKDYTTRPGTVYYRPLVELMRHSKVVTVYTHGSPLSISVSGDDPQMQLTSEQLETLPDHYFDYCQLVFLAACSTATSGGTSVKETTFLRQFKILGAQTAVGFNVEVEINNAHCYEYTFMNYLNKEHSDGLPYYGSPVLDDLGQNDYHVSRAFEATRDYYHRLGQTWVDSAVLLPGIGTQSAIYIS